MEIGDRYRTASWWRWIVGIDSFLLVITFAFYHLSFPGKILLLRHFRLTSEMNLAAWWSGVTLFVIGLLCYELYSSGRQARKLPWLVLAIVFAGLSFDEIGSVHERVFYGQAFGVGGWRAYIPYAVVGLSLVGYSLLALLRDPTTRRTAVFLALGIGTLCSAALHEFVEHRVDWPSYLRGIRAAAEEGSELLGMFLCLWGIVPQRKLRSRATGMGPVVPNPLLMVRGSAVLVGGAVIHVATSVFVATHAEIGGRGDPAVWYPSMLLLILSCVYFWSTPPIEAGRPPRYHVFGVALFVAALGIVYVYRFQTDPAYQRVLGPLANFHVVFGMMLVVLALVAGVTRCWTRRALAASGAVAATLVAGYVFDGPVSRYLVSGAFAGLIVTGFVPTRAPHTVERLMDSTGPDPLAADPGWSRSRPRRPS